MLKLNRYCCSLTFILLSITFVLGVVVFWVVVFCFVGFFEDEEESIQDVAVTTFSVEVINECKGENKLRLLYSTVVRSFAVTIPCCTFLPLDVCPVQSIKSLRRENLVLGRAVIM